MKKMTTARFIALLLFICLYFNTSKAQVHPEDSLQLISLYNANCNSGCTLNWDFTQPILTWEGITLENNRITEIELDSVELSGDVPNPVFPYLRILNLNVNNFTGTIPDFDNLPNLEKLYLQENQLEGPVPDFSNLPNLKGFSFYACGLTGTIPDFSNLPELLWFYLDNNNLNGSIPNFSNIPKLVDMFIRQNDLTGTIPNFDNLPNLERLNISVNQLQGSIPDFSNCLNLIELNLAYNQLSGDIPVELIDLNALRLLRLNYNELSGCYDSGLISLCNQLDAAYNTNDYISDDNNFAAPWEDFCTTGAGQCNSCRYADSLALIALYDATDGANWTNTWDINQPMDTWYGVNLNSSGCVSCLDLNGNDCDNTFSFSGNNLVGNIPPEIGNLTDLIYLDMGHNELSGNIPAGLGELINLTHLSLSYNQLIDKIPPELGDLMNLEILHLNSNQLDGSIPVALANLVNLTSLSLGFNQLTGNIPTEFANLSNLTSLSLGNNQLDGSIPVALTTLANLTSISLYGNQISGNIPAELSELINLTHLDLFDNQLTGIIPPELGDLVNLETLYLGGNQLTGNIPVALINLSALRNLGLGFNELSDTIPELGNLTNLEVLWLNNNQLTGSIPSGLGNLTKLRSLRLNNNQLTGHIPQELGGLIAILEVDLQYNQLSNTIPDFSNLLNLTYADLTFNKFSFEDIASNYLSNSSITGAKYSPQYYGIEQFNTDTIGAEVTLSPDPSIPYDNPSVKWLKNDEFITNDYTLNDTTYIIPSLDTADIGRYQYRFIDSMLTPLVEFYSLPINNYVEGLDLEGEPIVQGQLIIEYGIDKSQFQIDSIRNELITDYSGTILDSCGCKVKLDLWKFGEDTIDVVRENIGINGRHDRRTSSTEIDGNRNNLFVPNYEDAEYILMGESVENPNENTKVVVGVIDTGINVYHNAVYDNLWGNLVEKNGIPGIDDDQNGYIDDVYGYDFAGDSLMHDAHGHGTKVGGIITANTPMNMDIQVMPVRAFNHEGRGSLFDMLCGLYYAIDNGSDIINISAGYKGEKSVILQRALQYGRDKSVIFVVAAGNDTLDLNTVNYWPATFARDTTLENTVITVTAIDSTYNLMEYANYGDTTVTIAAFGQEVLAPAEYDLESFDYIGGTSASTPIISLALGIEKIKYPNKSRFTLYRDFLDNADIAADLTGLVEQGRILNIQTRQLSKLNVLLEGALLRSDGTYDTEMKSTLNQRGLLPGQIPLNLVASPTPSGQPYAITPWYYSGTEWGSTNYYLDDRVDWVLVSLRTEKESVSEIYRTAAQLKKDGTVEFYRPIMDLTDIADSVYVVVEHRNHMAVMSTQKVPVYSGRFVYDFTKQDSYKDATSVGQVEVMPGVWAMIVGDSSQQNDFPYYDINGNDKAIWASENGDYDRYMQSDYDMNGDVNGNDKAIWSRRIGLSNRVPK